MLSVGDIKEQAQGLQEELVRIRRYLHSFPELSYQEEKTGEYISGYLVEQGLEVKKGVGGEGVVALLRGKAGGRTVALRADMDALPVQDQKRAPYASRVPGVCHACGHDAHMAVVLGAARVLSRCREKFAGQVKFIFQPAEEKPPGGALALIQAGVLEDPPVDFITGIHNTPFLGEGKIGLKEGPSWAAADYFRLTIRGRSGHGAAPHQGIDAIVVAAQVIQAIQMIPGRVIDPVEPLVITIGTIQGGESFNILAGEVTMEGTVRTMDREIRSQMEGILGRQVQGITLASGASYLLDYQQHYPVLINHPGAVGLAARASREVLGEESVTWLEKPLMGSEDFARYLEKVPGVFILLGAGKAGKEENVFPWHHPEFDLDEKALSRGVALLTWITLKYLREASRCR